LFDTKDQIFTLPFKEDASEMNHNAWLYSPGSWHHAIDYSRSDKKTFQVRAAASGKVIHIGWDWWSGNTIVISHDAGGKTDVYRTIYMHLQNGPLNDCAKSWNITVPNPNFNTTEKVFYEAYLTNTGCPYDETQRDPQSDWWGTASQKIDMSLLGQTVSTGQVIAWSGSTGPGGCGCRTGGSGPNTHLHIFFAHRDPVDNLWYLFDPYGIYSDPSCYPVAVDGMNNTACSRYPVSWKNGSPQFPALTSVTSKSNGIITTDKENLFTDPKSKLLIFPNPTHGNITVQYQTNTPGNVKLVVYDKTGSAVFRSIERATKGSNIYYLKLLHFPSAIYYLWLNKNGEQTGEKFVIAR
jgi:hypothetical protein